MQRATTAILLMQSEEAEINFRSVAARAKVSTAWLYGTKAVRDKIMKESYYGSGASSKVRWSRLVFRRVEDQR